MVTFKRSLFPHGGSQAITLPKEAVVDRLSGSDVILEIREDGVFIPFDRLTNMESDPQFQLFIEALFQDAMKNPEQLKNLEEVWDNEWDDLLDGVEVSEED